MTITVNPVPDPPATADDAYLTPEAVTLTQPAPGVLANDDDSGGGTLIVNTTPVAGPANGILNLAADGSFSYTPEWSASSATDAFTYQATSIAAPALGRPPTDDHGLGDVQYVRLLYLHRHRPVGESEF